MYQHDPAKKHILIPTDEVVERAKQKGVKFGYGNYKNRIRYFIKTGLLPHQVRKYKDGQIVPHLPEDVVDRLLEIQKLQDDKGFKIPQIIEHFNNKDAVIKADSDISIEDLDSSLDDTEDLGADIAGTTEEDVSLKKEPLETAENPVNSVIPSAASSLPEILTKPAFSARKKLLVAVPVCVVILSLLFYGFVKADMYDKLPVAFLNITSRLFSRHDGIAMVSNNDKTNTRPKGDLASVNGEDSSVPININDGPLLLINIPVRFSNQSVFKTANIEEKLTAPNIIYSVIGSQGIKVGAGQNPTVTNTGVLSLGGSSGSLNLTAGSGIEVSGLEIKNIDAGSAQKIFSKIAVQGDKTVSASSNQDTLTFAPGNGIQLSANNKTITITAPGIYSFWGLNVNGTLYDNMLEGSELRFNAGADLDITRTAFGTVDIALQPVIDTVSRINFATGSSIHGTDTTISFDNFSVSSTGDIYTHGVSLTSAGTSNANSGATQIGVYDEFANSSSTNLQTILNDFDAAIGVGASKFSQNTGYIYLTNDTDNVILGGSSNLSGKLSVKGISDQIQLLVRGNSSQASDIAVFEKSDGTDLFNLDNTGKGTFAGNIAVNGGTISSSATTVNFSIGNTGTFNITDGANTLASVSDTGSVGTLTVDTITPTTLSLNGDSITDLTGNGLSVTTGALGLASTVSGGGLTYSTGVINVGAGNGIAVNANDIEIKLASAGSVSATQSYSGLESDADGLGLMSGCSPDQVLSWTGTAWQCTNADNIVSGDISAVGDVTSGNAFTAAGTQGTSLYFYDPDGRGRLTIADLSAPRVYTLPDTSGTFAFGTGTNGYATYWSGTNTLSAEQYLSISRGGTGTGTFTTNGVLYGNGGSALQVTSAGTSGQVLLANGSGVPTFTTIGTDATISNTGGLDLNSNVVDDNEIVDALTYTGVLSLTPATGNNGLSITASSNGVTSKYGETIAFTQNDDADATDTNAALNLAVTSSSGDADVLYGLNIAAITSGSATETALNVGSGWDSVLTVNGTSVINGSGTFIGTLNPGFTTGSVVYQGASGFAQDNSNFFWDSSLHRLGIGTSTPAGLLDASGTLSGTPSATVGRYLSLTGSTFTDNNTASSGTATGATFNSIGQSTLAASNTSVTTTNAYGLYLAGAPVKGTNESITNTTALNIAAGAVGAVTNSYGLQVNAQTGGTNNYAAVFSGGNVGIGTTAPSVTLHAYRPSGGDAGLIEVDASGTSVTNAVGFRVANTNATTNNWGGLTFASNKTSGASALIAAQFIDRTSNYGNLAFWTRGSSGSGTRLQIDSDGNVGIGTTTPAGLLDISKAISATPSATVGNYLSLTGSTLTDSGTASSGTATGATFNSIGQSTLAATNTSVTTTNAYGLYLAGAPVKGTNESITNTTALNIAAGAVGAVTNSYGLQVNAQTGGTNNYAAVFSGGNVGIGTTAPAQLLQVVGGSVTNTNITNFSASGTGNIYSIFANTNTAGTAFISLQESVSGSNDFYIKRYGSTHATKPGEVDIFNNSNGAMNFYTNASQRMIIGASGSVGIGTTTPAAKLHSLATTEQLRLGYDASNYHSFTVGSTGSLTLAGTGTNTGMTFTNSGTGSFIHNSSATTGVTTSSAMTLNANSLTTGTGLYLASSTLTSGLLADIQVSGTAAAASQTGLNILTAGATATNAITTYGAQISNTHTNATSGTNVALYLNASGATTANYGLIVNSGNVGIGDTTPASALTVGNGDLFQVNSSGAIAAATGIASSGTINFSGLTASSGVYTDASKNLTSTVPSSGTVGYWSRSGSTLTAATSTDALTITGITNLNASGSAATNIATGTGNVAIGNTTGTLSIASNGGLNATTAGALTGVASIDTIATSATALTFAGAGTISSTTSSAITLDSGTTGTVNLGTGNNAKTINIATGTAGDTLNLATGTGADAINIGTGATAADTITIGNTSVATTLALNTGVSTTTGITQTANAVTTGTAFLINANGISTGKILDLESTSTALTTGAMANIYWNPGSATTSTGDLFKIDTGANATVGGNLFALYNVGSSVFTVNPSQINANVPVAFNAAGDTSFAYDAVFSNQTASRIQSYAPFTIDVGEAFESNPLTLKTYNSGNIVLAPGANGGVQINQSIATSGSPTLLTLLGAADTTLTASTEASDVNFNLSRTVQFATGALTTERAMLITPPTYSFVGESTLTNATGLAIAGAPVAGTNATITTDAALRISSAAVGSGVTNSYGLYVDAMTGGTNNYAAVFSGGNVGIGTTAPAATVNALSTTEQLRLSYDASTYTSLTVGSNGLLNFTTTNSNKSIGLNSNLYFYGNSNPSILSNGNTTLIMQNSTYNNTSGNLNSLSFRPAFTPASGTANFAGMEIRPTINGTSSGKATAFVIDPVTNTLTGGTINLLDIGTTSADYFTGYTSKFLIDVNGNVGIGTTTPAGLLDISKAISATPSATVGNYLSLTGSTLTDSGTASSGTATGATFNSIGQSTLAATNTSVTTTNAYGLYLAGAPVKGTNESITNTTALNIAAGAVGAVTNSYGLQVNAQTGGTNNYAAVFSGGNVGIGTTSPGYTLDVNGTARVRGSYLYVDGAIAPINFTSASTPPYTFNGNTNTGMYKPATDTLGFSTGGSERLRIDSSGNLGIGTTTVSAKLHSLATTEQLRLGYDASNYHSFTVGSTGSLTLAGTGTNTGMTFTNSGTGSFIHNSSATTGVTTAAAMTLNANSLTTGTGLYLASSTLTSGLLADIQVSGTAAAASQTALNILTTGATASTAITTYGAQISNTHTNATSGTNVALYLNASGATTANYGLIVNSGNVGIGTTAPLNLLNLQIGAATTAPTAVLNSYYMGLGNAEYQANSYRLMGFGYRGASASNYYPAYIGYQETSVAGQTQGDLVFATRGSTTGTSDATERMRILSSGNVGIGTTAPGAKLHTLSTTEQLRLGYDTSNYTSFTDSSAGALTVTATGTTPGFVFSSANTTSTSMTQNYASLTTGSGIQLNINALTSGKGLDIESTSTALTTGNLGYYYWNPGSATTSTGDLWKLDTGTNATVGGNLFALYNAGSAIFTVSPAQITSNVPQVFNSAGDVSMANDLVFTNQTASTITSYGPLTLEAGENYENNNLTLRAYGTGSVVVDASDLLLNADQKLVYDSDLGADTYASYISASTRMSWTVDATEGMRLTSGGALTAHSTITGSAFDIAEYYPTKDANLAAGDLVSLSQDKNSGGFNLLAKSSGANDSVFGVVSTNPGFAMGGGSFTNDFCRAVNSGEAGETSSRAESIKRELRKNLEAEIALGSVTGVTTEDQIVAKVNAMYNDFVGGNKELLSSAQTTTVDSEINSCKSEKQIPVALSGRVPVKIDKSAGDIKAGDLLTASAINSGKAVKATGKGWVIGRALADSTSDSDTIMAFVFISWYDGSNSDLAASSSSTGNVDLSTSTSVLKINASQSIFYKDVSILGSLTATNISASGKLSVGLLSVDGTDNSINAMGEKLVLQNQYGAKQIEAFGGKFVVTTTGGIISKDEISAHALVAQQYSVLGASTVAAGDESTIGEGTIAAGTTNVVITNTNAKATSKIFVTANTSTNGQALIIKNKADGSFKVAIDTNVSSDIKFDYWIVSVK